MLNPLVSVVVTTYNHENFIVQALDSILAQETSFEIEVLVGEDDSTDSTRQLVTQYAAKHPDSVQLILQDRKNVISIAGMETGRFNFMDLLRRSRGKYIALCEGDDYWTDSKKLQKQVDLLESNADASMCFHDALRINENTDSLVFPDLGQQLRFTTRDLFTQWFIPTASMLFRNQLELPSWFSDVLSGDIPLHFLLSEIGDIIYQPELMSVYRAHAEGISNKHYGYVKAIGMSRIYHYIDLHFGKKYRKEVDAAIQREFETHVYSPLREELEHARNLLRVTEEKYEEDVATLERIRSTRLYALYTKIKQVWPRR